MTFKLYKDQKLIGSYLDMDSVDQAISEACQKVDGYKSHDSIHSLNDENEKQASYLVLTKVVVKDNDALTLTHNLMIDK
jgi:hypothetical protein